MSDATEAAQQLERRAWVTAGARFNACDRLLKRASLAVWAVSLMATYTIALSLASVAVECLAKPPILVWTNLTTIVFSLLVLVISIIESMREHSRVAYIHHSTALRLREVHNSVEGERLSGKLEQSTLEKWQSEYNSTLREAQLNHSDIDVVRFELERMIDRSEIPYPKLTWRRCILKRMHYAWLWTREYGVYLACILAPPAAAAVSVKPIIAYCYKVT